MSNYCAKCGRDVGVRTGWRCVGCRSWFCLGCHHDEKKCVAEAPRYLTEGTYRERSALQLSEWLAGRPAHNGEKNDPRSECCPDFSCCKPDYMAPLEEREAFVAAHAAKDEKQRNKMLGMFLGRLLAGEAPDKRFAITDGEGP